MARIRVELRNGKFLTIHTEDGWYRVIEGAVKPGDQYVNNKDLGADVIHFKPVPNDRFRSVAAFFLVIRRGIAPYSLCDICEAQPAMDDFYACERCAVNGNKKRD